MRSSPPRCLQPCGHAGTRPLPALPVRPERAGPAGCARRVYRVAAARALVVGRSASGHVAGARRSTTVCAMPSRASSPRISSHVPPYTAACAARRRLFRLTEARVQRRAASGGGARRRRDAGSPSAARGWRRRPWRVCGPTCVSRWSPGLRRESSVAETAAMPELTATAASVPSSAASLAASTCARAGLAVRRRQARRRAAASAPRSGAGPGGPLHCGRAGRYRVVGRVCTQRSGQPLYNG
jgi:hypothetical protein